MKEKLFPLNFLLVAAAVSGCSGQFLNEAKALIKILPPYRVAYVEYSGDFENNPGIYDVQLHRLLKWAVPAGLWDFPAKTKLIVIYPDDPHSVPKSDKRMFMAITVPDKVSIPSGYKEMTIPGGEYAVGSFEISSDQFGASWEFMYEKFIPGSGFTPASGMSFEIKRNDSDTHPGRKHIVDICIPVIKK